MESEIICLDTSILIDYYRKIDKQKILFFQLTQTYSLFSVSIISEYEVMVGNNQDQEPFCSYSLG
jgi:predicted nucleic acid-binding protein